MPAINTHANIASQILRRPPDNTLSMIDTTTLRNDFALLTSPNNKVIYFDSACMSLKPRPVTEAMERYYNEFPACGGRSGHALAERVDREVQRVRALVATFISAKHSEEIIFTRNTTEGINLVSQSLDLHAGDIVLTTDKEHNSNLVPWLKLVKQKGIKHHVIPSRSDNTIDLDAFRSRLQAGGVKLIAFGDTSNLDGVSAPVKELTTIAHEHGALVLVDAAQGVAHHPVNVKDWDVDFLAFSGHKLFGPTGTGILYGKKTLLEALDPFLVGGDTVTQTTYTGYEMLATPEKFEAGLQDYAGIIGLGAAIDYVTTIGWPFIQSQDHLLNQTITEGIQSLKGISIIGPKDPALRGGIVSLTVDGMDVHQCAVMLEQLNGILVRSGQHCVHSWFDAHHIPGSVRASFAFYNTLEEAQTFVEAMKKITSLL